MEIARTISDLRSMVASRRRAKPDDRFAFVPTMGSLHEGHLSLFREARKTGDFLSASIFVNRLQFNNPEDFEKYPRNDERDMELCRAAGVDLLFLPNHEEIYGAGKPAIHLSMPDLSRHLCGRGRPGHFEGVLYIVARLFHLMDPDIAFFGKKDYQQYRIIERMVHDLDFPLQIFALPTVREMDGLAMSSRNVRLSPAAREQATLIHRALRIIEKSFHDGNSNPAELTEIATDVIHSGSLNRVEYLSLVDTESLEPIDTAEGLHFRKSFLAAAAVECSGVRLIDNIEIDGR